MEIAIKMFFKFRIKMTKGNNCRFAKKFKTLKAGLQKFFPIWGIKIQKSKS